MTAPVRSPWLGLAALCLPMLIVSMDVSVLFFAVPFISADLNPTAAQQLWIFDVYGFVLAGLLMSMGAVADRVGHRRLLVIGATGFGIASVLAAYAGSAEMLITARALLAVAGATLMPSTLALVRHLFVDEKARTKAVAIWTAVITGSTPLCGWAAWAPRPVMVSSNSLEEAIIGPGVTPKVPVATPGQLCMPKMASIGHCSNKPSSIILLAPPPPSSAGWKIT